MANETCDVLFDRVVALRERIFSTQAHTIDGLGVKASVAWYERPVWAKADWREIEESGEQAVVALLADVLRLAGIEPLRS